MKYLRSFICLAFTGVFSAATQAQTLKQWVDLGTEALDQSEFLNAATYFHEAYQLDSTNFDVTIRYADALRLSRDYNEAMRLYQKAYDKDKGRLYPEGQYYLAQMQILNAKYSAALINLKKYEKRLKKNKTSFEYLKLLQEIAGCDFALNARMANDDLTVTPLKGDANSESSEFAPFLDDSTLVFTRSASRGPNISTFSSSYGDAGSQSTQVLEAPWIAHPRNGNFVLSPDKQRAYYTLCEGAFCAIYEARFINGSWSDGLSIPTINQADITATMPYIGMYRNQEVLFFSSDRKGTRGQLDVWWSMRLPDGSWDAPVNAGDNVNTPGNEITPYYSGEHLYFSSDWHPGFGGFDVFRSKGYPRSFDLPENLDRPINTSLNDLYYRYFPDQNQALLASNREGSLRDGSFCCNDLYQVQFSDSLVNETVPDIFVSLEQLNDYLPVTLYFHNDEPNPRTRDTTTQVTYGEAYESYLALRRTYEKEVTKGLAAEAREDAELEVEDFYTYFIEKGMRDLEQFSSLLLVELQKGYSIRLTIKGFASPRAQSDYNVNLTRRRIASLVNHLRVTQNGALLPYIESNAENHATLTFEAVPFGEYRADQAVSDALDDTKESIYSRGARLERKIEILSVQRGAPDSLFAQSNFDSRLVNFGRIPSDRQVESQFTIRNTGTDTLVVDSLIAPCGCTLPRLQTYRIAPGESTTLDVQFNPNGLKGIVSRKILLYTNEQDDAIELTLAAEIVD
jgi:hypothetical protein